MPGDSGVGGGEEEEEVERKENQVGQFLLSF